MTESKTLSMGAFEALNDSELFAVDGGKASEFWATVSITAGVLSLITPPPANIAFGVIGTGAGITSAILGAMGW